LAGSRAPVLAGCTLVSAAARAAVLGRACVPIAVVLGVAGTAILAACGGSAAAVSA
jgi:hypothetical protein